LKKERVLLGPITQDPSESVGLVNEALMAGLGEVFDFVPHVARRKGRSTSHSSMNITNLWYFILHLAAWLRALATQRPLIAHYAITSNWNMEKSLMFLWLAQLSGVRTVGHLHGGRFIEFWQGLNSARRSLARHVIGRLDGFVVLSDGWKEKIQESLGLPEERVHVVYNPLDEKFEHASDGFDLQRTGSVILCFGVMDRKKGVFDILSAAAALPLDCTAKFLLVGPEREAGIASEVREFIEQHALQDRVEWIGPVHGEQKICLFREASLFLLPSYVENFPVTVIESISAGVPVICTPVGAIPEFLVDRESAWFVKTGAPGEIAAAVVELLGSEAERLRLAAGARRVFVERLQRERIMSQLESTYLKVLDGLRVCR
jgi:glycosyltransferase involved in cell wall biosynthesis